MGEKKEGKKKKSGGAAAESPAPARNEGGAVTVELKIDIHCEGCAKKVRKSVKCMDGVESVKAESGSNKVTVVGKVDPVKVKERVEEKTKKKVELVSPPSTMTDTEDGESGSNGGRDGGSEKKSSEKSQKKKQSKDKKAEEQKPEEPQESIVVLKTRMHCEGCAQKIRKVITKYHGVEDVRVDLQKNTVMVKGTMDIKALLPYLNSKLKRTVEIIAATKKEASNDDKKDTSRNKKNGGGEKKDDGGEKAESNRDEKDIADEKTEGGGEKKKGNGRGKKAGGGEKKEDSKAVGNDGDNDGGGGGGGGEASNREYYRYPRMEYDAGQGYNGHGNVVEYFHAPAYVHAPQMFSDENPNACSVM